MSLEDKNDDEVLAYYLEIGVVNLEGMDENGEMIYSIDQEMAKEYAPELWQSHIDYVDKSFGILGALIMFVTIVSFSSSLSHFRELYV